MGWISGRVLGEDNEATYFLVGGEARMKGSEKRVQKTGRKGGRYLSLWDPEHRLPDLVIVKLLFQDPERRDAYEILREPSTTVLEMIATLRVPRFPSLTGGDYPILFAPLEFLRRILRSLNKLITSSCIAIWLWRILFG